MKVWLIDVDSHNFPNLALMKIWVNNKFVWRSCDRFEDYQ